MGWGSKKAKDDKEDDKGGKGSSSTAAPPAPDLEATEVDEREYHGDAPREEVDKSILNLEPGVYHLGFEVGKPVDVSFPSAAAVLKAKYGDCFVTEEIKALVDKKGRLQVKKGMHTVLKGKDGKPDKTAKNFQVWIIINEACARSKLNLGSKTKLSHRLVWIKEEGKEEEEEKQQEEQQQEDKSAGNGEMNDGAAPAEVGEHQVFEHPGDYHLKFENGKPVDVHVPDAASISKARYGFKFVTDEVKALVDADGQLSVEGGMHTVFKGVDGKVEAPKKFDLWIVIKEKYGRTKYKVSSTRGHARFPKAAEPAVKKESAAAVSFAKYDLDGNGHLDIDEFRQGICTLHGRTLTDYDGGSEESEWTERADRVFHILSEGDAEAGVDVLTYSLWIEDGAPDDDKSLKAMKRATKMMKLFVIMDVDGSGQVSRDEMREHLVVRPEEGQKMSEKKFSKLWSLYDEDGSGCLDYAEYSHYKSLPYLHDEPVVMADFAEWLLQDGSVRAAGHSEYARLRVQMLQQFAKLDISGTGLVNRDDFNQVMASIAEGNHGKGKMITTTKLAVACTGLRKADSMSDSDPVAVLFTKPDLGSPRWSELCRTECIDNEHNPVFQTKLKVSFDETKSGQLPVKFMVYDLDYGKADLKPKNLLGEYETTVKQVMQAPELTTHMPLIWKTKSSGSITIKVKKTKVTNSTEVPDSFDSQLIEMFSSVDLLNDGSINYHVFLNDDNKPAPPKIEVDPAVAIIEPGHDAMHTVVQDEQLAPPRKEKVAARSGNAAVEERRKPVPPPPEAKAAAREGRSDAEDVTKPADAALCVTTAVGVAVAVDEDDDDDDDDADDDEIGRVLGSVIRAAVVTDKFKGRWQQHMAAKAAKMRVTALEKQDAIEQARSQPVSPQAFLPAHPAVAPEASAALASTSQSNQSEPENATGPKKTTIQGGSVAQSAPVAPAANSPAVPVLMFRPAPPAGPSPGVMSQRRRKEQSWDQAIKQEFNRFRAQENAPDMLGVRQLRTLMDAHHVILTPRQFDTVAKRLAGPLPAGYDTESIQVRLEMFQGWLEGRDVSHPSARAGWGRIQTSILGSPDNKSPNAWKHFDILPKLTDTTK